MSSFASPARPLFSSRAGAPHTESPSQKERRLFLGSSGGDVAAVSPSSSPRSVQQLLAALHARRHSKEGTGATAATSATAATAGAAGAPSSAQQEPFVLKGADMQVDDSDKSEDGATVLLGEARLPGSGPLLITQTLPGTEPPPDMTSESAKNSPRRLERKNSSSGSAVGSPQLSRFHPGVNMQATAAAANSSGATADPAATADLTTRQQVPPVDPKGTAAILPQPMAEESKLVPPPTELDAPLDTMRPDGMDAAASSSSPSSAATAIDQKHALDCWPELQKQLQGKQIVVFLDYDGTLTPIVSEPSNALISSEQRARLAEVARRYPVSIVTGRKIETIKQFVLGADGAASLPGLDGLYFAGSHGFDISCPAHAQGSNKQVAEEYLPLLRSFYEECARECASIPGSLVEDSRFSISVHYRNASAEGAKRVDEIVTRALAPFEKSGQLQRHQGKMVYEIRPNIAWHKGAAVDYLLRLIYPDLPAHSQQEGAAVPELRRADGTEIVPVYIGDDTTDEDAFRLLRQYNRGSSHALSVFVRPDDKARHSAANYVVRDPHEVGQLLHLLAKL